MPGIFEVEDYFDILPIFKRLLKPYEHYVIAPGLELRSAAGGNRYPVHLLHLRDALVVD